MSHLLQGAPDKAKKVTVDIPKATPLSGKDLGSGDQLPLTVGKGGGFEVEDEVVVIEDEEDLQESHFKLDHGRGRGRGGFQHTEEHDLGGAGQGDWVCIREVYRNWK